MNANTYDRKEDVYLDGGPGPNAPAGAAGLPAGDYYFQVTDPSGKTLLSQDHVSCRRVHVNDHGVIDRAYAGTAYVRSRGNWIGTPCVHATSVDKDHGGLGAITVQLFPYADTPNKGGVYKAWMTPAASYLGDPNAPATSNATATGSYTGGAFGFAPPDSKTDNFKVKRRGAPSEPMVLTLRKFHDANLNGAFDASEVEVSGWRIRLTDPIGSSNDYYTRADVLASAGTWLATEDTPAGTMQTVAFLDGTVQSAGASADPTVSAVFDGASGEHHEVLYGDVGVGSVHACKFYDRNGNGTADAGEPGVVGWPMQLQGADANGAPVSMAGVTGPDGCVEFAPLLPGSYAIREQTPTGDWRSTSELVAEVTITSTLEGATLAADHPRVAFTNLCLGTASFGTKGYWHNKNGLAEMEDSDIAYANGLAPYATPSSYFDDGDEPFDGHFADGTPVSAQLGDSGEVIAPTGSSRAEVSRFLTDANQGGDPREQLAQQLLAFIFNTRQRLDDPAASIVMPDGSYASGSSVIEQAVAVWHGGSDAERTAIAAELDAFNNSPAVRFVHYEPCPVPVAAQ